MLDTDRAEARRYQDLDTLNFLDGVNYAFSPRSFGNMAFPYGDRDEIVANRRRFLAAAGINLEDVAFMLPVHKVNIEIVGKEDRGRGSLDKATVIPSTDALITTEKGVALALNAADCAPVIITNRKAEFLALYHAGRDGTDLQIGRLVISKLKEMGFANPSDFVVGIGPVIGRCCYTQQYIQTHTPGLWIPYLHTESRNIHNVERINDTEPPLYRVRSKDGSSLHLDLAAFNADQLVASGVRHENISVTGCCTACDARDGLMFSHVITSRNQGTPSASEFLEGRFMAVAQLNP